MLHNDTHSGRGCGRGLYAIVDQSPLSGRSQHLVTPAYWKLAAYPAEGGLLLAPVTPRA